MICNPRLFFVNLAEKNNTLTLNNIIVTTKRKISRRKFIGTTAAAGAFTIVAPHVLGGSKYVAPSDKITVANIGCGTQGLREMPGMLQNEEIQVVAVCDPDRSLLDRETEEFSKRGERVATYVDYRRLLEDDAIDAVVTASPNHWHALVTVWGCQAGKDVYVEKPVSPTVWEGRQMVNAARTYNRIVQSGTQRRSDAGLQEAIEYIRQGNLGKMKLVRGICYVRRDSIGKVSGPQAIPKSVDYDLWCGPAPKTPLMRKSLHYDWHWVWPTGDGDFGNNGIRRPQSTGAPRTLSRRSIRLRRRRRNAQHATCLLRLSARADSL